jgi:hypothetical protein
VENKQDGGKEKLRDPPNVTHEKNFPTAQEEMDKQVGPK